MSALQVIDELLFKINELAASHVVGRLQFATPHFLKEVLRVLMALPIVSTTEAFETIWERAAIRTSMALDVFANTQRQRNPQGHLGLAYRRSHSRFLTFSQ